MNDDILTQYPFEKILFISCRQTLTSELYSRFNHFDIKNYIDNNYPNRCTTV
jgi:hypothetical protein